MAPNVLPTRKLKVNGISPININARPVYIEFLLGVSLKKLEKTKVFFYQNI